MATQPKNGLTYQDLLAFPDDNLRRELIDGELIVTPPPGTRHQTVVVDLVTELNLYARKHGGKAMTAPYSVVFSDTNVTEPDVLYVRPENLGRFEARFLAAPPDVVVEVSSPSTRRLELIRKHDLYQRFGVPEYWFVDLEADRIEVYRLTGEHYGGPLLFGRSDRLESPLIPGFSLDIDDLLGPPEGD
jgi:Uma2 family endonuclease